LLESNEILKEKEIKKEKSTHFRVSGNSLSSFTLYQIIISNKLQLKKEKKRKEKERKKGILQAFKLF